MEPDGDPVRLTATVNPSDADNTSISWESSDENVVTISSRGTVEAVGEGTATITCTALDGFGATAICEVIVSMNTYTVNGVTFKMIPVVGGTFIMGAQNTDENAANYDTEARSGEIQVHNVTLSDYSIGETEVTQALWVAVMGSNPSNWTGDNLPVEQISWNDCQEFITKLNAATGQTFRLPTEAEWEYAARGGNNSQGYKYSGSNTAGDVAWYGDNSNSKTHEVGTKQGNELGLYDMSGNVFEWCQDWYGDYPSSAQFNPAGPASGSNRTFRGGSWRHHAVYCRSSNRDSINPSYRDSDLGFRLAK